MTTPKFTLNNQDLFEKIIRIIRKSEFEHRSDFETTELIMKEIEVWQKGTSIITPVCAAVLFAGGRVR